MYILYSTVSWYCGVPVHRVCRSTVRTEQSSAVYYTHCTLCVQSTLLCARYRVLLYIIYSTEYDSTQSTTALYCCTLCTQLCCTNWRNRTENIRRTVFISHTAVRTLYIYCIYTLYTAAVQSTVYRWWYYTATYSAVQAEYCAVRERYTYCTIISS